MSHHARLISRLQAVTVVTQERIILEVDTPIKCVELKGTENDLNGVEYVFEAALIVGKRSSGWVLFRTDEDLPAFTDTGSAHRARRVHATLKPGRPLTGEENTPVAVRVSREQRSWIERRAARTKSSVSEYVRRLLEAQGMPR